MWVSFCSYNFWCFIKELEFQNCKPTIKSTDTMLSWFTCIRLGWQQENSLGWEQEGEIRRRWKDDIKNEPEWGLEIPYRRRKTGKVEVYCCNVIRGDMTTVKVMGLKLDEMMMSRINYWIPVYWPFTLAYNPCPSEASGELIIHKFYKSLWYLEWDLQGYS